ncbi:MAG: MFS transporter [Myxococcota bacterium]
MVTETPPAPERRRRASPFQHSEFRWLFASNMSFFLAMGAMQILRPWLAFELTGSAMALGIVSAAVAIPMLALAPLGGVLADRVERKRLILSAQFVALLSEGTILLLLLNGRLEFWHLVVLAGVMGCTFPMVMPARQAIVAEIVGRKLLGKAVAIHMAGMNLTRVVGPAAAGMLIPLLGIEGVYALNMGLYVIAILAVFPLSKRPVKTSGPTQSVLSNMRVGMHYMRDNPLVLQLLVFGLVPVFLAMPFQTLLVIFANDVWEVGAQGLGLLNASAGAGAVAGSVYVATRSNDTTRLRLMIQSVVTFGLLLIAFAFCPWFVPALALILIANIFVSIFGTLNNASIQLLIPDSVRGRVSSFIMMSFSLSMLGVLPVSAAADAFGAPIALGAAAALAVAVSLVFYALSTRLRGLDDQVRAAVKNF